MFCLRVYSCIICIITIQTDEFCLIVAMPNAPSSLWAHPPLPPGKKITNSEDRRSSAFGFMRRFPSVRRSSKKENMTDATYESFDSLFEDNDIALVETAAERAEADFANHQRPFVPMFRSRSDGNLTRFSTGPTGLSRGTAEPKGLAKYLRVLSGSWKNLLNSKS